MPRRTPEEQEKRYQEFAAMTPEEKLAWREQVRAQRRPSRAQQEAACEKNRQKKAGFWPGLTQALRALQKGRCAICDVIMNVERKQEFTGEQADHCHLSGKPRGLLCMRCNGAVGRYEMRGGLSTPDMLRYLADPPAYRIEPPPRAICKK